MGLGVRGERMSFSAAEAKGSQRPPTPALPLSGRSQRGGPEDRAQQRSELSVGCGTISNREKLGATEQFRGRSGSADCDALTGEGTGRGLNCSYSDTFSHHF